MATDSDHLVRIGRALLFAQFTYLLLSSIGLFLWRVEGDASRGDYKDLLRFAFEMGLLFFVWRGWRWAKWSMVALCAAGAVAAAFIARERMKPEEMRVIVIAAAVLYGWIAISLVASRSINAFLSRHLQSEARRD
jgi:uncharacterized protein involved in response to NO